MSANEKLNQALRQEISAMTPNRVDDLLARLGEQQSPLPETEQKVVPMRPRRLRRQLVAAVLALVLLGGGVFFGVKGGQRSVVILDADAPVAFTVDGFDRVRSVRLEDARAVSVVDASQCTGKSLDDAVQNLTEQLIENNVLSTDENAVLVTVQEDSTKRAAALEQKANEALSLAAAGHEISPAVVLQTISEDAVPLAGASLGKSAYVQKLIGGIAEQEASDLAHAALQDLIYFSEEKSLDPGAITQIGAINDAIYYTAENAVAVACTDAGYDAAEIDTSALLGWDEAKLVYMATLNAGNRIGYYCISARTGEILDVFWEELAAPEAESEILPPSGLPDIPSGGYQNPGLPSMNNVPSMPSTSGWDVDSIKRFFRMWDAII